MASTTVEITIDAKTTADGAFQQVQEQLAALRDSGNKTVKGINFANLTNVFRAVSGVVKRYADDVIDAVAQNDRMQRSVTMLLTREIQQQGVVTKSIQIGTEQVQTNKSVEQSTMSAAKFEALRARQAEQLQNALVNIPKTVADINKAEADLGNMRKSKTETDAQFIARHDQIIARVGILKEKLGDLNKVVSDSQKLEVPPMFKTVGVFKTFTEQTIDFATAQALARDKTKELIAWMERLAIQSPFTKEDINEAFRFALAYSFTSDEARKLTEANINYAAAAGIDGEVMKRITVALGQIQGKGHVVGQEMRQLAEAGVPMRDILIESGKVVGLTTDNFEDFQRRGIIPAKTAVQAYVDYVNKYFGTAARDQAGSFTGILTSLYDIRRIAETDLFTPIFAAAQPYLFNFVNALQDPAFRANVKQIGVDVGNAITATIQGVGRLINAAQSGGAKGLAMALGFNSTDAGNISRIVDEVGLSIQQLGVWLASPEVQTALAKFQTDVLSGLGTALNWLRVNLPIIANDVATFVTSIVVWFNSPQTQAAINGFIAGVSKVVTDIVVWFNDPKTQAALSRFFTGLGKTIEDIANWIAVAAPKIVTVIGAIVTGIVQFLGRPDVQATIEGFVDGVLRNIGAAVAWLEANGPGILAAVGQVLSDVGTWLVSEFWPAFVIVVEWLVANVVPAFQDIARWINEHLLASGTVFVAIIGTIVNALIGSYQWLSVNIPAALKWLSGAFEWLGKAVQDVGAWLSGAFSSGAQAAGEAVGFFDSILRPIGAWIETNIFPVLIALGGLFKQYVETAFTNVAFIYDQYVRPLFEAIYIFFSSTIQLGVALFDTAMQALNVVLILAGSWLETNLMTPLRAVGTFFEVNFKKSIEIATGVFENTFLPILKEIWKFIENAWKKSWDGIVASFSEGGLLNKALKFMVEKPLEDLRKGLKFIEDLLKTVAGAIDWLTAALGKMKLPEFMQRHSPSELEMTLMGAATHLGVIKALGMPKFGDIGYSMSNMGSASPGGGGYGDSRRGGGVTIGSVNVGRMDDGLDVYQTARAFGLEAQRRFA